MEFEYKSNSFNTAAQCKREVALLKEEVVKGLGFKPGEVSLPKKLITLFGYSDENDMWIPISNTIGEFKEKIKSDKWSSYHLVSIVETR